MSKQKFSKLSFHHHHHQSYDCMSLWSCCSTEHLTSTLHNLFECWRGSFMHSTWAWASRPDGDHLSIDETSVNIFQLEGLIMSMWPLIPSEELFKLPVDFNVGSPMTCVITTMALDITMNPSLSHCTKWLLTPQEGSSILWQVLHLILLGV